MALDRVTDGKSESHISRATLRAFQEEITEARVANGATTNGDQTGIQTVADKTTPGAPGAPGDAPQLTRAQTSMMEAIKGWSGAENAFKGMEQFGPTFERAIQQADEDFTTKVGAMAKDYEANKPAVEKADAEMTAAEQGLSFSLRGIQNPRDRQAAAILALQYLQMPKEQRFNVDEVFKPFPEVAAAIKAMDKAATDNEPMLKKMNEWNTTTQALLQDRSRARLVYGHALDETGMGAKAQEMYKQGFGILGQEVPKQLLPKRDPNIREA